jgi:hypothetical protein
MTLLIGCVLKGEFIRPFQRSFHVGVLPSSLNASDDVCWYIFGRKVLAKIFFSGKLCFDTLVILGDGIESRLLG